MNETTSNWDGLTEAAAELPAGGNRISYDFSYADALEILRLIDTSPNVRKLALSIGDMKIDLERDSARYAGAARTDPNGAAACRRPAASLGQRPDHGGRRQGSCAGA